jgi:2-enoate reductase
MNKIEKLFEPAKIGKLSIRNRIVMAPMGIIGLTEPDGKILQRAIDYYVERAKGGVGLIVTGLFLPILDIEFGPLKKQGFSFIPRVDNPDVIPLLSELTDSVHRHGAKIAIQLTAGFGRVLNPHLLALLGMDTTIGASAVPNVWDQKVITRELTTEEVETLVGSFSTAAEIVKSAGFDAIELHGHEGYLMDQFTTSLWNKRKDKYGGDLDSRLRFSLEIIRNIKEKAGKDFPVIYRYAINHYVEGGRGVEESLEIARRLEKAGVDALHVDAGCYDNWYWPHPPIYQPPGCMVDMAETAKRVVRIPVIAVGKLGYPELAERILKEKRADFVAIGRSLLADPEWPLKVKEGRPEDIRPCIGCQDGCLARITIGAYISCAVNPATGNEKEFTIAQAEQPKSVLIVGGGIAGMEAARVAALMGHKATLYEKRDRLGGHLIEGSVPPFKHDLELLRDYYVTMLGKLGVKTVLGKGVTPKLVQEMKPDVVIIATGSTPIIPEIPGIDKDKVVSAIDLLLGRKKAGGRVVVAGGGLVGCETAIYLAQNGKRVTIVEMLDEIIPDVFEANKQYLYKMLAENGVSVLTNTNLVRVTDDSAVVINQFRRYEAKLPADTIVIAMGLKPERGLVKALEGKVKELHTIGDCEGPGRIMDAVWGAFMTMRSI